MLDLYFIFVRFNSFDPLLLGENIWFSKRVYKQSLSVVKLPVRLLPRHVCLRTGLELQWAHIEVNKTRSQTN